MLLAHFLRRVLCRWLYSLWKSVMCLAIIRSFSLTVNTSASQLHFCYCKFVTMHNQTLIIGSCADHPSCYPDNKTSRTIIFNDVICNGRMSQRN